MHAVRNIRLCTKDCLCLYVCPTGATDTETGQIDREICISGCRLCVDACPSHAISLVPEEYPLKQEKTDQVKKALGVLSRRMHAHTQPHTIVQTREDTPALMRPTSVLCR